MRNFPRLTSSTRREWLLQLTAAAGPIRYLPAAQDRIDREKYGPFWNHYTHIVNASTNQRMGQPFRLSTAVLRPGLRDRYRGRVSFRSSDPQAVLPKPYEFSRRDDRYESHLFEVVLNRLGKHTVTVRDEDKGREFPSNVILVSGSEPEHKLYFGDIHIHSGWSPDARGAPDDSYIYARDAMNLDFACLTEHDPTDAMWERIKDKAQELYEPGRFATMSAYEWTGHNLNAGHKNVYYRDGEGPVWRALAWEGRDSQTTSAFDLWTKLKAYGKPAMTLPHHPASKAFPVPWDEYDKKFQRCVEVYSTWGNSEYPEGPRQIAVAGGSAPGHFVQDALAAGQRLGIVGGSDSHSGRPGFPAHGRIYFDYDYSYWNPNARTGGFTGLYARELTREAVFDAIYRRRCYATTGVRIILDFRADDHWMGEEYQSDEAPHFSVKVIGTAPLESITLVKNNQDYLRMDGDGIELEFEYGKTERPQKGESDYYYVRVIQQDGEMAWSSPIWISRP